MPEIAINEDGKLDVAQDKIRATRKVTGVSLEGEAKSGETGGDHEFGTGVPAAYPGHDAAACLWGHDVAAMSARRG